MNASRYATALRALLAALIPGRSPEPVPGLSGWRHASA
jgi:hypothetical protein